MNESRFLTLDDLDVAGKRVLVRADLNVPMQNGRVTDDTRLRAAAPTILDLATAGAAVIVLSHFGRPKGARVPDMSLAPVVPALERVLQQMANERGVTWPGPGPVSLAGDCIGAAATAAVAALSPGQVLVLENLRFHPGEEDNDADFAAALAGLGDLYLNDAFSCAHRAHASTDAITRLLPAAAGRSMAAELAALSQALEDPARPAGAVVGGAKVSTKLDVLSNLVGKVDRLIVGGAMANTFLHALGHPVGASLHEPDLASTALDVLDRAATAGCKVHLPRDAVSARELAPDQPTREVAVEAFPADGLALDIGPETIADYRAAVADCRTLVWNGPLGAFEVSPFDAGTRAVSQMAAERTRAGSLVSVAGGGDTVAALAMAETLHDFSYISTAGGAFLEWLEGRTLPGVAALEAAAK